MMCGSWLISQGTHISVYLFCSDFSLISKGQLCSTWICINVISRVTEGSELEQKGRSR